MSNHAVGTAEYGRKATVGQGRVERIALIVVVAIGAVVRLWAIGEKPLWLDEAFSVWVAELPLGEMLDFVASVDHHPPLYYLLLHASQNLFGSGETAVRLPSALLGVAAMPPFYWSGRILVGRRAAWVSTLLLALSPFHVRYGQEARMYALMTFLAAIMLWALAVYLADSQPRTMRRRAAMLGLAMSQAALMLSHNTAAYLVPVALNAGVMAPLLWHVSRESGLPAQRERHFLRGWMAMQGIALAIWLPWLSSFLHQAGVVYEDFWIEPLTPYFVWLTFHNFNLAYPEGWFPGSPWWDLLFWALAAAGVFALRKRRAVAFLLVMLFAGPAALEIAISTVRPVLYDRTLIWTTLPYFLLIGSGLVWWGGSEGDRSATGQGAWRRRLALVAAVILLTTTALSLRSYFVTYEKEDWPALAAYVTANAGQDDLVLFHASWAEIPYDYYSDDAGMSQQLGLPVTLFERGELEPRMTEEDAARLRELALSFDDIWLVYAHDWYTDPTGLIPAELGRTHELVEERAFNGPRALHYVGR